MHKAIVTILSGMILTVMAAVPALAASNCGQPGSFSGLQLPNCLTAQRCKAAVVKCPGTAQTCGNFAQLCEVLAKYCGR